MSSSVDDPSIWSANSFIALDEVDPEPDPSTSASTSKRPLPAPKNHAPISFSSAFSAATRKGKGVARGQKRWVGTTERDLFPFGEPTNQSGFGGFQSGNTGGENEGDGTNGTSTPYTLPPEYDPSLLQEAATSALAALPQQPQQQQQQVEPAAELDLEVTPSVAPTPKQQKGKKRKRAGDTVDPDLTAGNEVVANIEKEKEVKEKETKVRKKGAKKVNSKPRIGSIFLDDSADAEAKQAAVLRGLNPKLAQALHNTLNTHHNIYQTAYNALNDELIKVQIEESVLRNIGTAVANQRALMRHGAR